MLRNAVVRFETFGCMDCGARSVCASRLGRGLIGGGGPKILLERPASYAERAVAMHGERGIKGPLTPEQVDRYYNDGFLILPNFLRIDFRDCKLM